MKSGELTINYSMSRLPSSASMRSEDLAVFPFHGFSDASDAALAFLSRRISMGLWMITRAQEDEWIILRAVDTFYGLTERTAMKWSDSFCYQMVRGLGPRVAADLSQIPAYAAAPINAQLTVPVRSYLGVPLVNSDGSIFGTLCAISPTVQSRQIEREQPLVELLGELLSTILTRELAATTALRQAEQSRAESKRDPMTGLFNRRGLNELICAEELRCQRYGHDACVISVDINGLKEVNDQQGHSAGDKLILHAADALLNATRRSDIVARTGGDEFVIIAVECGGLGMSDLLERVRMELATAHVSAAVGVARRLNDVGLRGTLETADAAMYADKRLWHLGTCA